MNEHGTPQPVAGVESGRRVNHGVTVCGVVGLILGIIAVILSFIPIINNAAAVLGFAGAVLVLVGTVAAFRGKRDGKVLSVVALVLSVLGIVITLAMQQAAVDAIDDALGVGSSQQEQGADARALRMEKLRLRRFRIRKGICNPLMYVWYPRYPAETIMRAIPPCW